MKIILLATLFILTMLFVIHSPVKAGGREISVKMKTGDHFFGELLSVRSDELLLSPIIDIDDSVLERDMSLIMRIPSSSIESVWAEGHSNVGKGMGMGFLIGAGAGAVIGIASGDDRPGLLSMTAGEKALLVGLGLGGCGFLIGTVVGAASRTAEIKMSYPETYSMTKLSREARYDDREPGFLRALK